MRHVSSNAETTNRIYPDPEISSILQKIKQKIDSPHQLEIQIHQLAELLGSSHSNHKINSCFVSDSNVDSLLIQAITKHNGNDLIVFASCKCLISMIDSFVNSQNELVNKMLKSGILQALHEGLTEMKDKNSPQTIQVILILIQRICTISQDIQEIKEHVIFDDCIWIVENTTLKKDIRIQALEILHQNKDLIAKYHKNITNVLQREIENKNINLVVPLLNAFVQLCSFHEPNSNQFSSESPEIKILARALNTFPEDKIIKSLSFTVNPRTVRKICTKFLDHTLLKEVELIIQNLEGGKFDQILLLNILFLRNETIHLCMSKGVINYIQNALEALLRGLPINTELIAACLVAFTRIADISEKYAIEIMSDRGFELLFKVAAIKDPEIIQRTCECLERLAINEETTEKIINNKFVDLLVQNVHNLQSNNEEVLKSLLLLLNKFVQLKPNLKSVMEDNIVQVLSLVLYIQPKDKLLNILSSEFLAQLRIASLSSLNISNILGYMKHMICLYPGWSKARVPVLTVTAKIYEHKGRLDLMQSERNLMDLLIIFLSNRFENQSFDLIREEYFENFGLKFGTRNVKDDFEEDMRSIVQETLQRLIRTHVICEKLEKFNESYQKFVAKPGKDEAVDLALILEFISAISQVTSLGMTIIKEQIPKSVLKIAEIASVSENIFIKEILLRDCALFFENLSKPPEISQDPDLQKTAISVLFLALNTQTSKSTLLQALHTIQAFIVSGLLNHNRKSAISKEELSLKTAISLALSRIRSFDEDHTIEELGIDLLKTALDINKLEHTSLILKAGGVRFCISIIENLKVPFNLFAKTLSLIDVLLENKEALILFTQNEAYDKIMRFLSLNVEMTEAFEAAKKPLEKLVKAQTEVKAREYKVFIEELLDSLASVDLETDEKNVAKILKEILCLSIVEENAKFILEKRGLLIIMSFIQNELSSSRYKKGQKDIQVNTEVLSVGLFAIYQLCVYASKQGSFDVKDEIVKMKFISTLSEILFNKQTSHEAVFHALHLMMVLTRDNQLQENFTQECLTNNYIEKLSSLLETYQEDTKIVGLIADVIFHVTQVSKEITLHLGQSFCLDSLLQEAKHVLRFPSLNKAQDLDLITINLKLLLSISAQYASKLIENDNLNILLQLLSYTNSETSKPNCSQMWPNLCLEIFSNIAAHKSLAAKFFDQGLLEIILPFIEPQTDINLMLKSLKLIRQACSIANHRERLIEYGLLNQILNLNIVFPESGPLQSVMAELTEILGGNALIPSIGSQFISLSQQLNLDNEDLINQYIQSASRLAGLFTTKENAEIEENIPSQVIESIDKTLPLSKDNPDLITAQVLLIKRLVNRDQSIKEQLINSALLELIVTDILGNEKFLIYDTKTKRTVLEFVQCFATRKGYNKAINGVTGEEIVIEDEVNAFLYAFIGDKGEALRNLLEIAKLKTCEESLLAVSILAGLASSNAKIATEIVQNGGVAIGFSYSMEEMNNVKERKNKLLGLSLLKELAKIPKASKEILENPIFIRFVEKLQEIDMQTSYEYTNLIQVLELIENVSKSVNLNRILLNDLKLIETLTGIVRKLTCLPEQQFKEEHMHLCQIIAHSLKAIQNLIQDPLLARSFIRENGIQDAFTLIKIFASVTLTQENKTSLEELMQLTDLTSNPSYLNKAIAETLGVIEIVSRRNKYSSNLSLVTDDSDLYQSLLNLVSNRIDDPIIGLYTLKIFQKRLMTMTREDLLENLELFMPICDLADSLMEVYPNIEIINKYGNSLKGLICSGMGSHNHRSEESNLLYQEKVQNIVQKIMNESGVEDLCDLLDLVEELLSKNDGKEWSEDEYIGFMIAISTLRDQMSENTVAEIVRRHEVGYDLGRAILSETIDEDTRNYVLQILQMIFAGKYSSVDSNIAQEFIDNIANYLEILSKNAGINKASNIELSLEIVKNFMHNLKRIVNINLKPLATMIGQFKGLILQNQKLIKLIIGCACDMIDYAATTAESFVDLGISILKILSLNQIDCDVELLQLYTEFIAKSANNFDIRSTYGKNDIITVLVNTSNRYPNNSELNKRICAAYQSLAYQHTENSTLLLNSPAISYIKSQLSLAKQESKLVETVCDLIATLLSSNSEAPSLLMKEGVLDELFSLLKNETDFSHTESVCKCFDTIEKFTQEPIVLNTIIEKGYIEIVLDFLRKPLNAIDTVGSVLRIIKNIVIQSKESALFKLHSGEIVSVLLNLLPIYKLNNELISLQIDILSSLSLFSENAKLISNHKGLEKVLSILKVYDFDRSIVIKCLEIVNATLPYEQNIDLLINNDSIQILNNLMLIHKDTDHILSTVFKIINQCLTGPDKCYRLYELNSLQTCFLASEEPLFQPETAIEFLKLLTKFAIVENIATFICEAGGIIVLNKIKENAQYPKVMDIGLRLLMSLITIESNLSIFLDNGILETLSSIVELHSGDEEITTQVIRVLYLVETSADVSHKEQIKSQLESILRMCPQGEEMYRKLKLKQRGNTTPELKRHYQSRIDHLNLTNSSHKDRSTRLPLKERAPFDLEKNLQDFDNSDKCKAHYSASKYFGNISANKVTDMNQESELFVQGRSVKIWLSNGDSLYMVLRLSGNNSEIYAQAEDKPTEKKLKIRVDEIQEVKKGYDSSSPFMNPKKCYEKGPNKDLCFSIIAKPEKSSQKTICVECLMLNDREKFLEQIRKLIIQ